MTPDSVLAAVAGYCAASTAAVALAYAGVGPGGLGKRLDGRRGLPAWAVYGPYLLVTAGLFTVVRAVSREPAFHRVAPNVDLGRRLTDREARAGGWAAVVDLAAEFSEVPALRRGDYVSVPVLDGTAPTVEQLRTAAAWIAGRGAVGPVYVHCALGHGRSACVVAVYLLHVGLADDARDAVRVRAARPGVHLNRAQRRALERFAAECTG